MNSICESLNIAEDALDMLDSDIFKSGIMEESDCHESRITRFSLHRQACEMFAQNLVVAMHTAGLSQTDLARILEINASSVSAWVNASTMPSVKNLSKLSGFFKTDASAWSKQLPVIDRPCTDNCGPTSCNPADSVTISVTTDEELLIRRVRRMSEDERSALYTLFHVFG